MTNQWVRRLARVSLITALFTVPNFAVAQDDDGAPADKPEAKPDEAKPDEAKPDEAKPDAKPDEAKPDAKPDEAKPDDAKPDDAKPTDEAKPDDAKADDAPPPDATPDDNEDGAPVPVVEEKPGSDDYDIQDAKDAGYEVGEGTNDNAEGLGIDGKDYELPEAMFAGMDDDLSPEDVQALTEVTPAELGELDMDRNMSAAAEEQFEKQAEAIEGLEPEDLAKIAALYIPILRAKLAEVKKKTHDKSVAKMTEKQNKKMDLIAKILALVSLSGVLLLLIPLVKGKKYPGQMGKLFAYSAFAGGALTLSILLLTGVLYVTRTLQATTAELTNPQIVIQDATFDAADEQLEEIAATPGLLLVPLQDIGNGEQEDLGVAILTNAGKFKEDFDGFKKVADAFKSIQGALGYIPAILTGLAVVLFLVSIKDLIKEILATPERAMRGEIPGSAVFPMVLKRVVQEIGATFATLGAFFVIQLLTAVALGLVAVPTMSTFVMQLLTALQYVFIEKDASTNVVYFALVGVLVFLVLAIGITIASGIMYLGKFQAIMKARLINGEPLSNHKAFFGWRTLAVLWCIALPVITLLIIALVGDKLEDMATTGKEWNWNLALMPVPIGLLVGFFLVFLAGLGLKAFLSIVKYKVAAPGGGGQALAQAEAAAGR